MIDPQDLQSYRRIETRGEARAAFDGLVARAQRSVRIADVRGDFYGFERKVFAEALEALLSRSRDAAVELVLHDASFVERHCPRVVALLRRRWPRLRVLRSDPSVREYPRGFALVDECVVLRRPHHDSALTFVDFDEGAVSEARTLLDELAAGATVAIGPSTTGL